MPETQPEKLIASNNNSLKKHATKPMKRFQVGSYLERLDEGPQQVPYALRAIEQLNKTHDTEQSEESDGHAHVLLGLGKSPIISVNTESKNNVFHLIQWKDCHDKTKLTAIACIGSTSYKRYTFYNNTS